MRKTILLYLFAFFLITNIPIALCSSPTVPIVYVAGDGSGDYNCDGIDDHVEINAAIDYVAENPETTTVYLKGPNTYTINDSVYMKSNMTLTGDSSARVRLINDAWWAKTFRGMFQTYGETIHNISIHGFEIDGNRYNQSEDAGAGFYNAIDLDNAYDAEVYDMYIHDNLGDGILVNHWTIKDGDENISVHDNTFYQVGHDALYVKRADNITYYNNHVTINVNSGGRFFNSNDVEIFNNTILSFGGNGGAGIQIGQGDSEGAIMDNIEIYDNVIHDTALWGIWLYGRGNTIPSESYVHIHNNEIYRAGASSNERQSGINVMGFSALIENNVIDNCWMDGIKSEMDTNYGPDNSGYVITVRNNIISNTQFFQDNENGYGIHNYMAGSHTYVIDYNCFYNNYAGNFNNVTAGTGNIYTDPLFVDSVSHDYHLDPTSPCIDAGDPASVYSLEPEPNDNRVNIGPYGNNAEASGSVSDESIISAGSDRTVIAGESVTLDGSGSSVDIGIVSYAWDFDDSDGIQQDATGSVVQHSYGAAGTYTATLTVTDAEGGTDSDAVIITVNTVNHAPVMNSIGAKSVEEESVLSFTVSALDADDDILTYSAIDLPSGARIDSSTGTFSWTPLDSQAGTYFVTFEVTDGQVIDSEEISITVNGNSNPTPSLMYDNRLREASPDAILAEDYFIDIGHLNGFDASYRDIIWFNLSEYNTTNTVSNATLSLYWYYPENSPRNQSTVVEVYRAADWKSDSVSWNNKAANTPWNNSGGDWFDANNVAQGSEPYASITFDANDMPDNRYYEFDVTELVQDYASGEYDNTGFFLKAQNEHDNYIAFYSSEWSNPDQRPKLTIEHSTESDSTIEPDDPPVTSGTGLSFTPTAPAFESSVGESTNFKVSSGQDFTSSTWYFNDLEVASGATTYNQNWNTAGTHKVRFDGAISGKSISKTWTVTVPEPANTGVSSVSIAPSSTVVAPGESFSLDVYIDPGQPLSGSQFNLQYNSIVAATSVQECGLFSVGDLASTFNNGEIDNVNSAITGVYSAIVGSGTISETCAMATVNMVAGSTSGIVDFTLSNVVLSDANSAPAPYDVSYATVLVDTAPQFSAIPSVTVDETESISFTVAATDAEGDELSYSATSLPGFATFDANTATFNWNTVEGDAGTYTASFAVTDGYLNDSVSVALTVEELNNAPVITLFEPADGMEFEEGSTVDMNVAGTDSDGQSLSYIIKIDGEIVSTSADYSWSTDYSSAGTYTITAIVSDGIDDVISTHTVTITDLHPRWDVNEDGSVNVLDITLVGQNYGLTYTSELPRWDVNQDGIVNIQDLSIVSGQFGETVD